MTDFETLKLEFNVPRQQVVTITINRPDVLNSLNSKVGSELTEAIGEVELRLDDIKVLIITGSGSKSFVAGADIDEMVKLTPPEARNFLHSMQQTFNRLEKLPIPVIAKINGYAFGGGLELALSCDIRIASENAVVGLPEVTLGLIPSAGGTQRLTRVLGEGKAKYLIMTAKRLRANEAKQYGLLSEVTTVEELDNAINKLLDTFSALAPIAVGAAKRSIQAASDENLISGLEIELDEAVKCFQTKDLKEGMNAFLEKRKADFKGI